MPHPRSRCRNSPLPLIEPLEPRTLLNGLTLITHGYIPFDSSRLAWLDAMASAIVARKGPSTAVYTLRVEFNSSNDPVIQSFKRISGPASAQAANITNENVLLLDYAQVSGVFTNFTSTETIANLVTPVLTTTFPALGMTGPLAQGPIHLIGHSRGASLISEIAKDLGQSGIWVDQVTTLDPRPVGTDPDVSLRSNTIFADNYFQNTDAVVQGFPITGALNAGPLDLPNGYNDSFFGIGLGTIHDNVHLFYQGTVDLSANASDSSADVNAAWYPSNNRPRAFTGFYYSRLVGGARPLTGTAINFGGTAPRSPLTLTGPQWPNVGFLAPSTTKPFVGQDLTVRFKYQNSSATNATLQLFLDKDQNPYNNNSIAIGAATTLAPTAQFVLTNNKTVNTKGIAPAGYFLEARISNSAATRYGYTTSKLTITPMPNLPPRGFIDFLSIAAIKGWTYDPNTPSKSIVIGISIDRKPATWSLANKVRPDVTQLAGSSNHGFSLSLPFLTRGKHTLTLYAVDTTSNKLTTLATKSFIKL